MKLRFMALHITAVRMEPDAATVAPQAMSSRFWITMPQKAAARPGGGVQEGDEHRHVGAADADGEQPRRGAPTAPGRTSSAMRGRSPVVVPPMRQQRRR